MSNDSDALQPFWSVRQDDKNLPLIPLPFYASSTGISVYPKGQGEQVGGILNQFVKITWLLSGTCETLISDRKQLIGPGTVSYTLYGEERFFVSASEECRFRWLCIDGPYAEAVMLAFRYPRVQFAGQYPQEQFRELDEIMGDDSAGAVRRKSCLVMEILSSMAEADDSLYPSERLIRKCLGLIRQNLSNPDFDLEELCGKLAVSRATLNRLFHRATHFSPGRYILNEKMSRAVALLTGTDLPVETVAGQCGFRDRPTFTRFIRRAKGMSPSEFRKRFGQSGT